MSGGIDTPMSTGSFGSIRFFTFRTPWKAGDLGTLQIGISSKGAETEEDFSDSLIKKARINFRPGSAIVGVLSNLSYSKVKPRYTKADKEAEEEEDGEDLTS